MDYRDIRTDRREHTMPLLPGKSNIGTNIKTEQAAGKPYTQALAIALNVAGAKIKGKIARTKGNFKKKGKKS
jgi:hypothetical protein